MTQSHPLFAEARLALTFGGVGLVGFFVDASVLHIGLWAGLPTWGARILSLFCAMQATFTINGLFVFRGLRRERLVRQWAGYMLANGFGNFCNYWIFLTLVSTHWPMISNHLCALAAGSGSAWLINFIGTRLFVFKRLKTELAERGYSAAPASPVSPAPDDPSRRREPV
jgi:putative flippase GtrA